MTQQSGVQNMNALNGSLMRLFVDVDWRLLVISSVSTGAGVGSADHGWHGDCNRQLVERHHNRKQQHRHREFAPS